MPVVEQAGAVAVRGHGADAEVLIVRAKRNPAHWIFPKGHIEPGETAAQAALRELREEAGVVGEVTRPLGTSGFQHGGDSIEVSYFLVRCRGLAAPAEHRETRWLPFSEARDLLTFEDARRHLDAAEQVIAGRQPL